MAKQSATLSANPSTPLFVVLQSGPAFETLACTFLLQG